MRSSLMLVGAAASLMLITGPAMAQGRGHASAPPAGAGAAAAHSQMGVTTRDSARLNRDSHASASTDTLRGPDHTGQPGVECGTAGALNTPGNAATAPGSPFNEAGRAGEVYAGEQPQNSRNTASVSQYDSACAHVPGG